MKIDLIIVIFVPKGGCIEIVESPRRIGGGGGVLTKIECQKLEKVVQP